MGTLHIYDLCGELVIPNTIGRALGTGAFHVGVEVYGEEWTFNAGDGVTKHMPKKCWGSHVYRESIQMGTTELSRQDVHNLCFRMWKRWKAPCYNLYSRNCCHFADSLCINLGVGPMPTWLNSLASGLAAVSEVSLSRLLSGLFGEAQEVNSIPSTAVKNIPPKSASSQRLRSRLGGA